MRVTTLGVPLRGLSEALSTRNTRVGACLPRRRSYVCQQCQSLFSLRIARPRVDLELPIRPNHCVIRSNGSRNLTSSQRRSSEAKDTKVEQHELPSRQEFRRSNASKQLSHVMDNIQTNLFAASQRLNDLTGYSAIESLKKEIQVQEDLVQSSRFRFRGAKESYTKAINQRSQSQREVNELLQRKHAWSPQDLERFTSLYRSDHANEQAEAEAQVAVTEAEYASEEAAAMLNAKILARYHEEQIWSDKIRRMSTWGTWGLMGVNVLLFLVFQIGVEPWRRQRLVKGFEEKVVEALEKEIGLQRGMAPMPAATTKVTQLASHGDTSSETVSNVSVSDNQDAVKAPARVQKEESGPSIENIDAKSLVTQNSTTTSPGGTLWKGGWTNSYQSFLSEAIRLFSTQTVELRQVDVTTKFIEGALSSAVVISLLAAMFRGR